MIYPSILTDSVDLAQRQLGMVNGKINTVQLDIIDTSFSKNPTITAIQASKLSFNGLRADLHLQTLNPVTQLSAFSNVNEVVRAVIGQVERMKSQAAFIAEVKTCGWMAGLSLDLFSPISALEPDVWEQLDVIQIMGIYAGKQEQEFQTAALKKIAEVKKHVADHGLAIEIMVDGGINPTTATECVAAGAESFAVGSYLWQARDISEALFSLQQIK